MTNRWGLICRKLKVTKFVDGIPQVRMLHPLGFISMVVVFIISIPTSMFSDSSLQSLYREYWNYMCWW